MLNIAEDDGFLINLNLAIKTNSKNISRAPSKTRTKVFIAISALYSEDYSFIYNLELFFQVLFQAYIYYTSLGRYYYILKFQLQNFKSTKTLIKIKKGSIDKDNKFIKEVDKNGITYYILLIPYIKELRKVVFLEGKRWLRED